MFRNFVAAGVSCRPSQVPGAALEQPAAGHGADLHVRGRHPVAHPCVGVKNRYSESSWSKSEFYG